MCYTFAAYTQQSQRILAALAATRALKGAHLINEEAKPKYRL